MTDDRERRRRRIIEITCRIVEGQVAAGEVDPDNPEELKRAVRAAAETARAAYNAAEEFVSG